jgi:hypothetical protein
MCIYLWLSILVVFRLWKYRFHINVCVKNIPSHEETKTVGDFFISWFRHWTCLLGCL